MPAGLESGIPADIGVGDDYLNATPNGGVSETVGLRAPGSGSPCRNGTPAMLGMLRALQAPPGAG